MDIQRLILSIALVFVLLLLWQAWQEDYGTPPQLAQQEAPAATSPASTISTAW